MPPGRTIFPLHAASIAAAASLAGAAGLIAEIVWSRYLHLAFGISAYAVMTTLVAFMLGYAAGSWLLGRRADRHPRPKLLLALILALLAACILASPWLYPVLAHAAAAIVRNLGIDSPTRHIVRFLLALAALALPTALLGGIVPVAVRALASATPAKSTGTLYALHTLGGAIAVLLAAFLLIPTLGLTWTLHLAAALSTLGAIFLLIPTQPPTPAPAPPPEKTKRQPDDPPIPVPPVRSALTLFTLSGFTALAYQLLWTRLLTFFFKDSTYDLAIVLATFLLGIVLGGFLGSRLAARPRRAPFYLALLQILIAFSTLIGLHLIAQFPYWINDLQTPAAAVERFGTSWWLGGNLRRFGYALLLMLVPTTLFGATFPLVTAICTQNAAHIAQRIGLAAAFNTVGATLGALFAGIFLIRWLGIYHGILLLAAINLAAALTMLTVLRGKSQLAITTAVVAVVLVSLTVPPWDKRRMSASFLDQRQPLEKILALEFYEEDAQGTTAVIDLLPLEKRFLVTNRLFSQNTSDMGGLEDHRRLGHLPMLLHPDPQQSLVIGMGAGITLRGVAELSTGAVDCVELSPGVLRASHYFARQNADIRLNPKVTFHTNDGRNFLATTTNTYDAIVLDIFFPMSSGSSAVFSREYFQLCRQKLKPNGLVTQWLPAHQLSLENLKSIIATFQSVFPHTSLWFGMMGESLSVVGCVGTLEPLVIDAEILATRLAPETPAYSSLREVNLHQPALVLSHFIMAQNAVSNFTAGHPIDTDDHPLIEFSAPKLAARSRAQGITNLRALASRTQPIAPHLKPGQRIDTTRQVNTKKLILEALEAHLRGEAEEWTPIIDQSLIEDPQNPDLLWLRDTLRQQH